MQTMDMSRLQAAIRNSATPLQRMWLVRDIANEWNTALDFKSIVVVGDEQRRELREAIECLRAVAKNAELKSQYDIDAHLRTAINFDPQLVPNTFLATITELVQADILRAVTTLSVPTPKDFTEWTDIPGTQEHPIKVKPMVSLLRGPRIADVDVEAYEVLLALALGARDNVQVWTGAG